MAPTWFPRLLHQHIIVTVFASSQGTGTKFIISRCLCLYTRRIWQRKGTSEWWQEWKWLQNPSLIVKHRKKRKMRKWVPVMPWTRTCSRCEISSRKNSPITTPAATYPWKRAQRGDRPTPVWGRSALPFRDRAGHPVWPGSILIQSRTTPFEERPTRWQPCAYYKEEGHWKKDCSKLKRKNRKNRNPHQDVLERKVLADGRRHGKKSGHFIRQPKCCFANHHYLKPDHPAPGLREAQTSSMTAWKSLTGSIGPAAGRTWLVIIYRWEQLHGEWSATSRVCTSHRRQGSRRPTPHCRNLSTNVRALELSRGKNVNIYTDSKNALTVVHAHGQ